MRILLNTVYSIEFAQFYFRVFVKEIIFPYSIIHGNQADLKTKCPGIVEFAVEAYNKRGENKTAKIKLRKLPGIQYVKALSAETTTTVTSPRYRLQAPYLEPPVCRLRHKCAVPREVSVGCF